MKLLFEQLHNHANRQPGAVAIRSQHLSISYAELLQDVEQLSNHIRDLNAASVGLYLDNGIEWIVMDLACSLAGVTTVPLPWFFSQQQLQHACNDAAVDYIAASDFSLSKLTWMTGSATAMTRYRRCSLHSLKTSKSLPIPDSLKGSKVSYTSGTTGNPKGIRLDPDFIEHTALSISSAIRELDIERHLSILPYAALLENIAGIYVPLMQGKTIYAEPSTRIGLSQSLQLNPQALEQTINEISPESLIITPQLLEVLCVLAENQLINTECLQFVAVGGARVTASLVRRARLARIPAYEGYGLTEFGSVALLNTPANDRVGSAGKPLPGVTITIAEDGEICLSTVIESKADGQNSQKIIEVATGDLGEIDDDGFVYVQGRKSSVIVLSTGRNVSPEWVEAELNASPLIRQIYVYGEGQARLSALIVAVNEISDQTLQSEIARINLKLPVYARVADWHRLQQAFSTTNDMLTPNGRLKRDNIQHLLAALLVNLEQNSAIQPLPLAETNRC